MCLLIHPDATPSSSPKDIEVYKVVDGCSLKGVYYSPFMGHLYNLDTSYTSSLEMPHNISLDVFGVEDNIDFAGQYPDMVKTIDTEKYYGAIEIGLHSFSSLEEAKAYSCDSDVILRCVIPAGTEFYKGAWGYYSGINNVRVESYASSALTVIEEVE